MLIFPVVLILACSWCRSCRARRTRPSRRPVAVLTVLVLATTFGVLTYEGVTAPWSPKMTAWSGDPVPPDMLKDRSPLQLQGAAVLQVKQCRNCHALDGVGGRRGPDLSAIGVWRTRDQLIDQISNGTPGGGNMPAFGKEMTPAEMDALVAFLITLRPAGSPPAEPPTRDTGPTVP